MLVLDFAAVTVIDGIGGVAVVALGIGLPSVFTPRKVLEAVQEKGEIRKDRSGGRPGRECLMRAYLVYRYQLLLGQIGSILMPGF